MSAILREGCMRFGGFSSKLNRPGEGLRGVVQFRFPGAAVQAYRCKAIIGSSQDDRRSQHLAAPDHEWEGANKRQDNTTAGGTRYTLRSSRPSFSCKDQKWATNTEHDLVFGFSRCHFEPWSKAEKWSLTHPEHDTAIKVQRLMILSRPH